MSILGGGLTIDMERINSQQFRIQVNCQSPIVDPGGENFSAPLSPYEAKPKGCNYR